MLLVTGSQSKNVSCFCLDMALSLIGQSLCNAIYWSNMGFRVYWCSRWNGRIELQKRLLMESTKLPARTDFVTMYVNWEPWCEGEICLILSEEFPIKFSQQDVEIILLGLYPHAVYTPIGRSIVFYSLLYMDVRDTLYIVHILPLSSMSASRLHPSEDGECQCLYPSELVTFSPDLQTACPTLPLPDRHWRVSWIMYMSLFATF
jgi:hypothetical protein